MVSEDEVEDFLEHFGVKGMKWGVKKAGGGVEVASASKKAPIDKAKLSTARIEAYKSVGNTYKSKKAVGAVVVGALLGGGVGSGVVGYQMMRSTGYSKGKSFAVGGLLGPLGSVVAIEKKARSQARSD